MLFPKNVLTRFRSHLETEPWAHLAQQHVLESARSWLEAPDETLWGLMFGPTITRSWDVWSNGHCPSCRQDVPLYNWIIDAWKTPWKVTCPHCHKAFPTNDFSAFYRSGLDAHFLFEPARADRSLLFNAEHPDASDPLRSFGVDDGEGFVQGNDRWRFIGAYLVYGQWKQMVLGGIGNLAAAYLLTGDPAAARKAAILLNRVADLYPSFDFKTQAWVEEVVRCDGYVSTWHDACEETREMALAYDAVRPGILADPSLAGFLDAMARRYHLPCPKDSPAAVCRNIENGIFRDALKNPHKIYSNYPRREIALSILQLVLGAEDALDEVHRVLDAVLEKAIAVDGVTGEKGLSGYSAYVIQGLAVFLAQMERLQPGCLAELLRRHPKLRQTYRFHIDTWCLQKYYPLSGDCGWFAARTEDYAGVPLPRYRPDDVAGVTRYTVLQPSLHGFLGKLHEITGDPAYAQVLFHANGGRVEGLPYDLFAGDPAEFRRRVGEIIAAHGPEIRLGNVVKDEWHLAILRAGRGEQARAIWLDWDIAGNHGHIDAMNVGLFARGLDLMPDYGYPPLQFERCDGRQALWYRHPAAHNTVVIDGQLPSRNFYSYTAIGGQCTLWASGRSLSAVRASARETLLTGHLSQVADFAGEGHDRIGLYLLSRSRVRRVEVFTRAPGSAPGEPAGWKLQFRDDFDRANLGPDWKILEGDWKPEGGVLIGSGILLCTRRFPGPQKLVFEASTDENPPRDLSAFLSASEAGLARGVFFGFGSNDNSCSKLLLLGREAARTRATATSGRWHTITCEHDGGLIRHTVDGQVIQAFRNVPEEVRKSFEEAASGWQYERTLVQVDVSDADSYYFDVFRVVGGSDHAKFMHSHFGQIQTHGLALASSEDYGYGTLMRNFRSDPSPRPGWSVDWRIDDRYGYVAPGLDIHLRYTDLTSGASASVCEGWVSPGIFNQTEQAWIPRLMVRRQSAASPLVSTFVGLIEPYEGRPLILSSRRLALRTPQGKPCHDGDAAIEVILADGRRDLLIALDVEDPLGLSPRGKDVVVHQKDWRVRIDGELAHVRLAPCGNIESLALCRGDTLLVADAGLELKDRQNLIEARMQNGRIVFEGGSNGVLFSSDAS